MKAKRFSAKLFNIISEMGISQKELSGLTGISQSGISKMIGGTQDPSYGNIIDICKSLHISPNSLFPESLSIIDNIHKLNSKSYITKNSIVNIVSEDKINKVLVLNLYFYEVHIVGSLSDCNAKNNCRYCLYVYSGNIKIDADNRDSIIIKSNETFLCSSSDKYRKANIAKGTNLSLVIFGDYLHIKNMIDRKFYF